jgi:hypothetical protein
MTRQVFPGLSIRHRVHLFVRLVTIVTARTHRRPVTRRCS